MKKVILTLLVSLQCIMLAKATVIRDSVVVDTLPQRVINGLTVIPIRITSIPLKIYSKRSTEIFWELRVPGFEKKFQHFESLYPGCINYNSIPEETGDSVRNWPDNIWQKIVPMEIKTLVKETPGRKDFEITLHVDHEGDIFDIAFWMADNVFQSLNSLSKTMIKDLHDTLSRESCKIIKQAEFQIRDEHYPGKEYVLIKMPWAVYDMFGTFNFKKALKEVDREQN